MYSVEIAARTKMNSLSVVAACRIRVDHRVEEGLGELGLAVVDEQADVAQLDAPPGRVVERRQVELGVEARRRTRRRARRRSESAPCTACWTSAQSAASNRALAPALVGAEQAVVLVEALDQELGDRARLDAARGAGVIDDRL